MENDYKNWLSLIGVCSAILFNCWLELNCGRRLLVTVLRNRVHVSFTVVGSYQISSAFTILGSYHISSTFSRSC